MRALHEKIRAVKLYKKLWVKLCAIGFMLSVNYMVYAADPEQDMLSGVKAEATTNFGANSTFIFLVYLVEVIGGAVAYLKTKSWLSLIPIFILMIYTTYAFKLIG